MGCFSDKTSRDLPVAAVISVPPFQMPTLEQCLSYCGCRGYSYAAMQYFNRMGLQCFCGNSYGAYGAHPTGCTVKCVNSTSLCGNYGTNSVYSTKCFLKSKVLIFNICLI